jgi:hypothetical protein
MTIYNSSDFGLGPNFGSREPLESFQGFLIYHGDEGYYWNGHHANAESDGFFETIEECRQDICDYHNAAEDGEASPS